MAYKHSPYAMKKLTFMMLLAAFFTVEIKVDGKWYDVTKYPYTRFGMDITFYEGGKFYGSGYLGNGSGTYTVSGKTITTYVSGKEYAVYTVNSLNGNEADLTLRMGSETLQMKAKKQY